MAAVLPSNISSLEAGSKTEAKGFIFMGVLSFYSGKESLPLLIIPHWPELAHIHNSRPISAEAEWADQTS